MTTIHEVAQYAQVSIATVSRYLNDTAGVRPETGRRVREAIAALDFQPNQIGRSLKTASTRALGIVIPSLENPVFAQAVSGFDAAARRRGYSVMMTTSEYDQHREIEAVETLLRYQVDGLALTATRSDAPVVRERLAANRAPYTLIYNEPTPDERAVVTVDNAAAAAVAAEHLVELGHRRLAMITGRLAESDRASRRRDGFVGAIARLGLPAPQVREVDFSARDVRPVLEQLLGTPATRPTALFCSNDRLAIAVIGAANRMGLRVPRDISVVGFDGIDLAREFVPSLTTVVQPSYDIGYAAAKAMLDRRAGQDPTMPVILPFSLRIGESTAPLGQDGPTTPRPVCPPQSNEAML
ncbi:hypothetical protein CKO28_20435 [Rhodovibrio sodomensis]|uniref:HTH lacI-type domain-containing protein n=1 Tax=Rhodovibrio sodomensis TaxID=1088 RepID=A0ABS1DIT7_9PROT|nr:LacI family DNA-binding transcriptional regulator [Rhodovibrio sodomensis]MBK1670396.1 hypothetical protein [Rhodovibrio sodomensis]